MLNVIFLGTPDFAVPVLRAIAKHHNVLAVVTKLDKPRGRNMKPSFSPVKIEAINLGIPVYQYKSISKEGYDDLKSLNADIIVTCAFGQILKENILNLTPYGVYNVHGSLLPKYRGAAPIQRAIMDGEKITGITILKSDIGIDDGDLLIKREFTINDDMTSGQLFDALSLLGADTICEALDILESGNYTLIKQNESDSSYAKMINLNDELIDFNMTSEHIVNVVRGLNPAPVAKFTYDNNRFKVYSAKVADSKILDRFNVNVNNYENGQVVLSSSKAGLFVKCCNGVVEFVEIQAPNSKRMQARAYLNGKTISVGAKLYEGNLDE